MTFTPYSINPDLDLELVRDVPVTARAVFEAWTDPDSLKQWFAPRPYSIPLCEVDLRPGGGFRTVMNDPDGNQMMDETGCDLISSGTRRSPSTVKPTALPSRANSASATAQPQFRPPETSACSDTGSSHHGVGDGHRLDSGNGCGERNAHDRQGEVVGIFPVDA